MKESQTHSWSTGSGKKNGLSLSRNDSHDLEETEATTFTQRGVVLQHVPQKHLPAHQ